MAEQAGGPGLALGEEQAQGAAGGIASDGENVTFGSVSADKVVQFLRECDATIEARYVSERKSKTFEDLKQRTEALVACLKEAGFQVWRYKIEGMLIDVRTPPLVKIKPLSRSDS